MPRPQPANRVVTGPGRSPSAGELCFEPVARHDLINHGRQPKQYLVVKECRRTQASLGVQHLNGRRQGVSGLHQRHIGCALSLHLVLHSLRVRSPQPGHHHCPMPVKGEP